MNNSVLIVDDSRIERAMLKRQLQKIGIRNILEEEDGSSALSLFELFEENSAKLGEIFPPNIIFLDINMPIMNGIEFLEKFVKLRSNSPFEACSVIMYSSSMREEALKYNFVKGFVIKGESDVKQLKNIISTLL